MPASPALTRRSRLWIADSDPGVAATLQFLTCHYDLAEPRVFSCKQRTIECLQTESIKPTLLITDGFGGPMRGDDFIRLAQTVAPTTKLILFSAIIGTLSDWRALAGPNAPAPDAIVEKPDIRKLMTRLRQIL